MRLSSIVTEDTNDQVLEPLRIAFLVAFVTADALSIYSTVVLGNAFDIQAFGIGMGGLILTTGGGLYASSHQKETAS